MDCAALITWNKEGYEVTVIDRNDITDGCSIGNMGCISPSHFTPLATPGIISQGLKWMLSFFSFLNQTSTELGSYTLGNGFSQKFHRKKSEESIPHLNNLLQLSRELMSDLKKEFDGSFTMIEKGCWMLYRNPLP